jgi:putative spermidine/putrescine transport system permease protein
MADIAAGAPRAVPRFSAIKRNWSMLLLSLPAVALVLALFIYPFIFGFDLSLRTGARGEGPWTLDNYIQFFSDPRQVATIWTTFQVALPVTMFTVAVSLPLAYFMRRGIRFERLITIILILPITLGTVMVAQCQRNARLHPASRQ